MEKRSEGGRKIPCAIIIIKVPRGRGKKESGLDKREGLYTPRSGKTQWKGMVPVSSPLIYRSLD